MTDTKSIRRRSLEELVELSDSGTWGDEATSDSGSPVLRSTNISDYRLTLDEPAWRNLPANDLVRRRLNSGDILVTKSSGSPDHIGKCGLFQDPHNGRAYYFSNFILRLRAKKGEADPRWLFYWLTSVQGRFILQQMNSTTTGLRNLSIQKYLQQQLPTPSLSEQSRIADLLDKADGIWRSRRKSLSLTRPLVESLFDHSFGQPITNTKRWPILPLSEVVAPGTTVSYGIVQCGPEFPNGVPYIRTSDISNERLPPLDHFSRTSPVIAAKFRRSTVRKGDLVFANRATIGAVVAVPDYLDGANLTQGTARIAPGPAVLSTYLLWVIRSHQMQAWLDRASKGATFREITMAKLREAPIPVPPMPLQVAFQESLNVIAELEKSLHTAAQESNTLFQSLTQRAFKGDL